MSPILFLFHLKIGFMTYSHCNAWYVIYLCHRFLLIVAQVVPLFNCFFNNTSFVLLIFFAGYLGLCFAAGIQLLWPIHFTSSKIVI